MNQRVQRLAADLFAQERRVSLERALLYTASWQQTQEEPIIVRRARATAHILDHVVIAIRPDELLVGNRTVRPRSGIISPEMDPYWILQELDTIQGRPQDPFAITETDKGIYRTELFPYWQGRSLKDRITQRIRPDIQQALTERIFALNQTDKGQGHIIMDFPRLLNQGLNGLLQVLQHKQTAEPGNAFCHAAVIVYEALQNHIRRYGQLAENTSKQWELPQARRRELQGIAAGCHRIAEESPRTFWEACQLLWFVSLAAQYESNASSLSLGRFDQYMLPFYRYSLAQGESPEQLREVLACFCIKTNDVVLIRSQESARYFAGFPTGYTITLGGVDNTGQDASNELSRLLLDVHGVLKLPQPNLSVRLHQGTPQRFLQQAARVIRMGTGMPQLFNDEVIIPGFTAKGVAIDDARDYAIVGCVELSIPGRTYGLHDIAMLNLARIMERTLHSWGARQGEDAAGGNQQFAAFLAALATDIRHCTKLVAAGADIVDEGHGEFAPTPFLSSLIADCVDKGLDVTAGGARYNFSGVQGIGQANVADSLYALQQAVFVEGSIGLPELLTALRRNFTGPGQEKLRQRLQSRYAKYGNDVDEVDQLAADVFAVFVDELDRHQNRRSGPFTAGAYTVSAHIPLGAVVGATPDGRRAGEQLADGGLSPMIGRDLHGPTAVLKSVSKLDHLRSINGSLLNLKLSPDTLADAAGMRKFMALLRAFVTLKIQHVQFNVISRSALRQAQADPKSHGHLLVRVAGYSAFFVDLDQRLQDDIIERAEHRV